MRLHQGALEVGERVVPLLSGAVHYWRVPRECWRAALTETRDLGCTIVETYVPWQVHELGPREFDFGQSDPQHDLGAFLDLAHEIGLLAFVRPGPHINSEMTYFGLPERIVCDERIQARSPRGNPVLLAFPPRMFAVPSYASEKYHVEVGHFYDAVGRVVQPRLWPDGPVALLQVDNEAGYWFRDSTYDQDYHPDAIARYREWLAERYGSVEELERAHRATYGSFDGVSPPTRFEAREPTQLPAHLDWSAYREALLHRAIDRFRERMSSAGLTGVPTVHNLALGELGAPVSANKLEEIVDIVGLDFYHARREYRTIKRRALYLTGTSRLPFAPEMGAGAPYWFTPLTHEDSLFCAMVAFAFGVRGMNLYMAVDRDRWYGAPIDHRGNPRLESASWKTFLHALTEVRFHSLRLRARVGLVVPREYARLSRATHLLGPISPITAEAVTGTPTVAASDEDLGFRGPIQVQWWTMVARFAEALSEAGVPYLYLDSDTDPEMHPDLRVLVTPSFEFAEPRRWKRLCAFANQGGKVVFGPAMPSLDETMHSRPFEVPHEGEQVLVDRPEDAHDVVAELVRRGLLEATFRVSPAPLEISVHEDEGGPRVLFVINPESDSLHASIEAPMPMRVRDALTGESFEGGSVLGVPAPPFSCRMLIVESSVTEDELAGEAS